MVQIVFSKKTENISVFSTKSSTSDVLNLIFLSLCILVLMPQRHRLFEEQKIDAENDKSASHSKSMPMKSPFQGKSPIPRMASATREHAQRKCVKRNSLKIAILQQLQSSRLKHFVSSKNITAILTKFLVFVLSLNKTRCEGN